MRDSLFHTKYHSGSFSTLFLSFFYVPGIYIIIIIIILFSSLFPIPDKYLDFLFKSPTSYYSFFVIFLISYFFSRKAHKNYPISQSFSSLKYWRADFSEEGIHISPLDKFYPYTDIQNVLLFQTSEKRAVYQTINRYASEKEVLNILNGIQRVYLFLAFKDSNYEWHTFPLTDRFWENEPKIQNYVEYLIHLGFTNSKQQIFPIDDYDSSLKIHSFILFDRNSKNFN